MQKLKKQEKEYLLILYVLWNLLDYHADLYYLNVPPNATKLRAKIACERDNVTHILLDAVCMAPPGLHYSPSAMKEVFNEYLNIMMSYSCRELAPFSPADPFNNPSFSYNDQIDCLYVYRVAILDNGHCMIDLIYIDNMQAYRKVRADQNIRP